MVTLKMGEIRHVIIDTDPGIDDLHAIFVFVEAEKLNLIKIEAFTVTVGNTNLENGCKNLVRFLEIAKRTDIPIYKGVSSNLLSEEQEFLHYGHDGLGDLTYETEPNLSIIKDTPSPIALMQIIRENPGKITLVCLGPLTNIAITAKIYNEMFVKLKEIFIMGGTCQGKGNITPSAEFNFYFDPESVYIFLQKVTCPTTILPYEPCSEAATSADWRFDTLLNSTPEMKFLTEVEKHFYAFVKQTRKERWMQPDIYLAIMIIYPDLIVKKREYHMNIELYGMLTRGQCVLDHTGKNKPNVIVVEELSKDFFVDTLLNIHNIKR